MQKVSTKNTKTEILEAYSEALQKLENINKTNNKLHQIKLNEEITTNANGTNKDNIIHNVANLKLEINKYLDDIEKKLITEKDKFDQFKKAKEIEEQKLKESYNINIKADTLEALILTEKEKKKQLEDDYNHKKIDFDSFIADKKLECEKLQKEFEQNKKEEEHQIKIKRQREEEEYKYQMKIRKQKDEDEHNQKMSQLQNELENKKNTVEKELVDREQKLKGQEDEFNTLKEFKLKSEENINKEIEKIKKDLTEQLSTKYNYETQLKTKETEGQINLLNQKIKLLEEKLQDKQDTISNLSTQMYNAQMQAQELAKKIIDNNSINTRLQEKVKELEKKAESVKS